MGNLKGRVYITQEYVDAILAIGAQDYISYCAESLAVINARKLAKEFGDNVNAKNLDNTSITGYVSKNVICIALPFNDESKLKEVLITSRYILFDCYYGICGYTDDEIHVWSGELENGSIYPVTGKEMIAKFYQMISYT